MLLLFLPALLYWEALTSSVREIRHNLRSIALRSTVLGPALPAAVRRARFDADEVLAAESVLTRQHLSAAALRELPVLARRYSVDPSTVAHLERDISDRVAGDADAARRSRGTHLLVTALLRVKRQALTELRDAGRIDDIVLRGVQDVLDAEDVRLSLKASRMPATTETATADRDRRDRKGSASTGQAEDRGLREADAGDAVRLPRPASM
ncbi:hypothetical protein [Streptomyces sp. MA15]|uniref:hypothetical protein n=1 Tax=Streptomyces sp. MA15 TaxID=3055061 RepID=UPI0025AF9D10|nr:hypothetical protein [Streptomyces sp. MA15]MDN3270354.1 hypothetical protein [Streptomyces sp. MA15]